MVGRGVAARVALAQQPGQRLPTGDLWTVQKRQQRMVPERLFPGRSRILLVVGVVDDQRGVNIDVQPVTGCGVGTGSPGRRSGRSACSAHPRQARRIDTLVDQPPHGGRRGRRFEHMLSVTAKLPDPVDTVRAISHGRRQIGEHRARRIRPRALVRIGQCSSDLRRQSGQVSQLTQQTHPRMRHHAMTVSRYPSPANRCATLHLESALPLGMMDLQQSHYPLQDRHFR
ncbi:hypothetical protein LAUMK41_05691 [Mycobacterium attenuatum]|nr:hypothetical protein LAUMK41_05691 [Mycobacterium attenuatum]